MYIQDTVNISLDSSTKRELIGDRLYIRDCVLTSAVVNDYFGKEIGDSHGFNLNADQKYGILRPLSELKKSFHTYNAMPVLHDHEFVEVENPNKDRWHGTTGTNAHITKNDLLCDVVLWDKEIIDLVDNADADKRLKDLSAGYLYQLVAEEGIHEGKPYQFKMVDLVGNHLAVVSDGRVERARLSDSNILKGEKKMKKKSALGIFMDAFFGDKKAMDNEGALKGLKEIADKASDEFEGGESEQAKAIIELARKIEVGSKAKDKKAKDKDEDDDDMTDAESDEPKDDPKENPAKDKKAKDSEKDKDKDCADDSVEYKGKAEKEGEYKYKKDKKAMDSQIQLVIKERSKAEALCTKVVGRISPAILADSTPEQLITNTLKAKGFDCENKSYDIKMAMLEVLAGQSQITKNLKVANDSIAKSEYKTVFEKLGV